MSRPESTIARLPPTGLDRGARKLLLEALEGWPRWRVLEVFFEHAWADVDDYLAGLEQTGNAAIAHTIRMNAQGLDGSDSHSDGVLTYMPDGDFLLAVEKALARSDHMANNMAILTQESFNTIRKRRGVPYRLSLNGKFEWTGDPLVETEVLAPTLSALDDPRLSGGPQDEFMAARAAMRDGKPQARQHAVAMACNAVESGLTVLLKEHGQPIPNRAVLGTLLKACRAADLFPKASDGKSVPIEHVLGAAGYFGNARGRHGAGEEPHGVEPDEAEAVIAAAAVALTLIARRLPDE